MEEPREQMLFQQAKELMKVYTIPDSAADGGSAGFVLLSNLDTRKYVQGESELRPILQRISAQVGYEREWRLIIFYMQDADLFDQDHNMRLVEFLAHVMYYRSWNLDRLDESCYLTCEKPENIWLVSLKNESSGAPISLDFSPRPDETRYYIYPPNCRFLQYTLNYQRENYFRRALLELHCGVRSLARDTPPPDLLRGNNIYSLKVELDERTLCDSVEQYDRWLQRVERTLQQQERQLSLNTLSKESVPIIDPIDESEPTLRDKDVYEKKLGGTLEALKELEAQADNILDRDSQLGRRRLQDGIERLQMWEAKQGHQMMSASAEKLCRKEMEDLEQQMLQPEIKYASTFLAKVGDWIFNLRGTFRSIWEKTATGERGGIDLEREYWYVTKIEAIMREDRVKKICQVMRAMTLVFLFVLAAIARAGMTPDWKKMFTFLCVSFVSIGLTYLSFEFCYKIRRKKVFRTLVDIQRKRILQNRKYFNKMGKYLRLSWALNYNDLQKGEMEDKRAVLQERKRELDYYKSVCAQLKICCVGMQGSGRKLETKGSIQRMLTENSCSELFGIQGRLPELTLNGNRLTGAFPFIKAIYFERVPANERNGGPAAGSI